MEEGWTALFACYCCGLAQVSLLAITADFAKLSHDNMTNKLVVRVCNPRVALPVCSMGGNSFVPYVYFDR